MKNIFIPLSTYDLIFIPFYILSLCMGGVVSVSPSYAAETGKFCEFKRLDISDGLSHNMVNTIYKDKRGFIWIGTQLGLDRYDGVQIKPVPALKDHSVFAVCETDSLGLWIATDKGLFHLDYLEEKIKIIPLSERSASLTSLYLVSENFLLAGSRQGLYIYEKGVTRHLIFDRDIFSLSNLINDIAGQGEYWIATSDGLVCLDSDWTEKEHPTGTEV